MTKYQQYEEYKDSGVNFLDDIPEHWVVSKVKYLAPFQVGWTPPTKSDLNFIGENLWVNISDLKGKVISNTVKQISDKAALEASMDITPKGSLMYSFKLSVGAVSFAGRDMYTNEAIASFLDTAKLPLSYLYYALPKFVIENASTNIYGAKILNQELIRNAILLELPFDEAEKISHFLDHETAKIDSLIEKQQLLIQLLKEKRQAVISHAVTKGLNPNVAMKDSGVEWLGQVPEHWQTPCTKYLLEIPITDGPHETPQFVDEGIPFISAEAIHKGKINFDKKRGYIKPELNDIYSKKYSPKLEDIYMVKSGATTGKVAMVETEEKFNIWSPLAVFRCNKIKILPKFLLAVFNSNHFYDALVLNWSYGTQQNIGMGVLSNIEIPCPPINEQQEIIQHIDNELKVFKNLENKANHAIQLMQERRTVLISSAVTGKIDVRNWQKPTEAKMEFSA